MDKTRTVGQKWLANELDLLFLDIKKVYQRPIQSVNSFKSYRANKLKSTDRQTYRQTDTFAKTIFSGSEGLKTWTFDKNGGHILHKSNTFSDENVKMVFVNMSVDL